MTTQLGAGSGTPTRAPRARWRRGEHRRPAAPTVSAREAYSAGRDAAAGIRVLVMVAASVLVATLWRERRDDPRS